MEVDGPFMEDRLVQPRDIYPAFFSGEGVSQRLGNNQIDDTHLRVQATFLEIQTDEGATGISSVQPATEQHLSQLKPLLIGRNPLATEKIWDQMHRTLVHGRQGHPMMAVSSVDNALWDLKGKWLGQPVYMLVGGPTRDEMPVYASMLGHNATDMGLVRERAQWAQSQGYAAHKWFFRNGPMQGKEGLKKNVALVKTLRETLGEDDDIMLDCWQSMDANYVVDLASRIEEYRPRWLEECLMPDRIESHLRIKAKTSIPLSGAEHEYTRWGFKRWIDSGALDIIQPDCGWAGGLSEVLKIAAMASAADLITICHQGVTPVGMAFSASQSPIHTPYVEMLVKHASLAYHFVRVSEDPGFGFDIDDAKVESEEVLEL
jgi:L-alanine-DL-glutamate epimerase-like enolase superfamily enzyme